MIVFEDDSVHIGDIISNTYNIKIFFIPFSEEFTINLLPEVECFVVITFFLHSLPPFSLFTGTKSYIDLD